MDEHTQAKKVAVLVQVFKDFHKLMCVIVCLHLMQMF